MRIVYVLLSLSLSLLANDPNPTIQNLLSTINSNYEAEKQRHKEREQQFLQQKKKRQQLLREAKATLQALKAKANRLNNTIDSNEKQLALLEEKLLLKKGDLGELFGSFKTHINDFVSTAQSLPTISSHPIDEQIAGLVDRKKLPNITELTLFWQNYLEQIIATGNIEIYPTTVIDEQGGRSKEQVMRLGVFTLIGEQGLVEFIPATGQLVTYPQDTLPHTITLKEVLDQTKEAPERLTSLPIDPTRGSLFRLYTILPTMGERIDQGGIIGYIIIALGVIGLLFAMAKMVQLIIVHRGIKRQIKQMSTPSANNPLGRILLQIQQHITPHSSKEHIESLTDEMVLSGDTFC